MKLSIAADETIETIETMNKLKIPFGIALVGSGSFLEINFLFFAKINWKLVVPCKKNYSLAPFQIIRRFKLSRYIHFIMH